MRAISWLVVVLTNVICLQEQVGLSRACRLAQGQIIKIQLFFAFPVQVDGEPWLQKPCMMTITHHGQVSCPPSFLMEFC